MFVFAGIALLSANSPVLGTLVSGEYRTASAGGADQESQPRNESGDENCTSIMITAISLSSLFSCVLFDASELIPMSFWLDSS